MPTQSSQASQLSLGWSLGEGRKERRGEVGQEGGVCVQVVVGEGTNRHPFFSKMKRQASFPSAVSFLFLL